MMNYCDIIKATYGDRWYYDPNELSITFKNENCIKTKTTEPKEKVNNSNKNTKEKPSK